MLTKTQLAEARRELFKVASRQDLASFVLFSDPNYRMGWVHREICAKLDEFLSAVQAKKSPRLIICLPPRSGKSEIISRRFPAYVFGRFPNTQMIASSYSADLTSRFNRDLQRIMESDEYREVFPASAFTETVRNCIRTSDFFEVPNGKGAYRSTGIGGGITGQGADILVIDDPVKDRADASSETIRNSTWDWYTSTAYTRLSPGGGVIVMATRWHQDDLIGRLISHMNDGSGDKFEIISYPAIAEQDEPHRKAGEALHPARYPLAQLEAIRKTVGIRDWSALYQQHPVPDGGAMFRNEWIQHWTRATLPPTFETVICSWDMSFKDSTASDFVVGQVWAKKGANLYLLDQVRGRWDFIKTKEMFLQLKEKHPKVLRKLIEDKANGSAIISELKQTVSGIVPITPHESKQARASAVTPFWEARNVFLPPVQENPWLIEFEAELLNFPSGAHDDQVDAMTQALNYFREHRALVLKPQDIKALRSRPRI